MMSTEVKSSNRNEVPLSKCNGKEQFIECNGSQIYPANAIFSGYTEEDVMKRVHKPRHHKSLFDYFNEIADTLPQRQAFFTMDLADVLWKVQEWKKHLPKVEIFYAIKANTDPILLQLLTELGISFDCASWGEIKMMLEAGASPENIIFAHTIKTVEELKLASEEGVKLMTFDNEDELMKIHRVYQNAELLVRINPETISCSYDLSEKFGCTKEDAIDLLKLAHRLNLDVVGVSFHVGALCTDPTSYTSTIETARRLFDVASDIGFTFSILDIGGGFFGSVEAQHIFHTMAKNINKALEDHFSNCEVRVIAEPGAYMVSSACNLVCTVLGRRCFDNAGESKPKRHYYLNDGVYGSFYSKIHAYDIKTTPLLAESEMKARPKYKSRLYGQTCCPTDVITHNVLLSDLKIGERLIWCNMGGYCHGVSTTFCGVPLSVPRYVFVHNQRLSMDWIILEQNICDFLKKHVTFIGCTENDF